MKWIAAVAVIATFAFAPAGAQPMSQEDLLAVTEGGRTITLGGPGMGYSGTLVLAPDGTGSGSAQADSGAAFTLTGPWEVRDGAFCRRWEEFDDGAEVCETWVGTGPGTADVLVDGEKIGANSW